MSMKEIDIEDIDIDLSGLHSQHDIMRLEKWGAVPMNELFKVWLLVEDVGWDWYACRKINDNEFEVYEWVGCTYFVTYIGFWGSL